MSKLLDLTGTRYGKLVVLSRAENYVQPNGRTYPMWQCKCECGTQITALGTNLTRGRTRSCGCLRAEMVSDSFTKHGMSKTRLYRIWTKLKHRCYNPKNKSYKDYGGRGIAVCDEWLHDFKAFYDWAMANGYRDDLSIDRIDSDKGYSQDNCRWANSKGQVRNRRTTRYVTVNGVTKPLAEFCDRYGIDYHKAHRRIQSGWSIEEALGIVPRKKTE